VPPPGVEKADFFPLAKRLPTTRARQPALRYYVNRFPTFYHFQAVRNAAAGRTTSKRVRTVLSSIEEKAIQDLKVMDKLTFKRGGTGGESAGDAEYVCAQGNVEVRASTNGQRHIQREQTTEARVEK
jgi:hypothetical protein